MPHVIVEGPITVSEIASSFAPFGKMDTEPIIKVTACLLSTQERYLLLECLVVENRLPKKFYLRIDQREAGVKIALDPLTDPEKTKGVKTAIVLVARRVRELHDENRYGNTNLQEILN
jgi:hypothetical protein